MKVNVHVKLRDDILDPEGQAIAQAVARLGHDRVTGARVGKIITLDIASDGLSPRAIRADIEKVCAELLVNPVTEEYSIAVAHDEH